MSWEEDFDARLPKKIYKQKDIQTDQPCMSPLKPERYSFEITNFRAAYGGPIAPRAPRKFSILIKMLTSCWNWCKIVFQMALVVGAIALLILCLISSDGSEKKVTFIPIFSGKSFTMIPFFH